MKLSTIKEKLSISNISSRLQLVVRRFPIALYFLLALAVILTYLDVTKHDVTRLLGTLTYFFSIGMFLDLLTSLWAEEQPERKHRLWAKGISFLILAVYCVWLYFSDITFDNMSVSFSVANASWILAIVICIPFVSFLREKDDVKSWHFIISVLLALLFSFIIAVIMYLGILGLTYGSSELFGFHVSDTFIGVVSIWCLLALACLLFFILLPHGEAKHNTSVEIPRFLLGVVKWLLMPLLGCYMLVLYAYTVLIIVHWELPKGTISWLVSAVMFGFVLCYTLLYPQIKDSSTRLSRLVNRWLPVAILPLLILMTVGVCRRVSDYGITAPRLYIFTLLAWYYLICLLVIFLKNKRIRWIFLSFSFLFLFTSGHPLNYYRICQHTLTAKFERMIAENNISAPFALEDLSKMQIPQENADNIYSFALYMRRTYGNDVLEQWVLPAKGFDEVVEEADTVIQTVKYNADVLLYPKGNYSNFERINVSEYLPTVVSADKVQNGILPVACNPLEGSWVLLVDTAQLRQASEKDMSITIPTEDNSAVLVPQNMLIKEYPGKIEVSYFGYLFK